MSDTFRVPFNTAANCRLGGKNKEIYDLCKYSNTVIEDKKIYSVFTAKDMDVPLGCLLGAMFAKSIDVPENHEAIVCYCNTHLKKSTSGYLATKFMRSTIPEFYNDKSAKEFGERYNLDCVQVISFRLIHLALQMIDSADKVKDIIPMVHNLRHGIDYITIPEGTYLFSYFCVPEKIKSKITKSIVKRLGKKDGEKITIEKPKQSDDSDDSPESESDTDDDEDDDEASENSGSDDDDSDNCQEEDITVFNANALESKYLAKPGDRCFKEDAYFRYRMNTHLVALGRMDAPMNSPHSSMYPQEKTKYKLSETLTNVTLTILDTGVCLNDLGLT